MYDAIIIGARCAGAPTAMLLARAGLRVLLLDQAIFPKDRLSTLLIHPRGLAHLQRWQLLDAVMASNCPPLPNFTLQRDTSRVIANILPVDGIAYLCAPRRYMLDQILVNAAVSAGAELGDGVVVEELLNEAGRIAGIRGRTLTGQAISARATIVIGADGVNSLLAHTLHPATYHSFPALTCLYYAFFSNIADRSLELFTSSDLAIGCVPTNDDLYLIGIQWPIREFAELRKNIATRFYAAVERFPNLADRLSRGQRAGSFKGTAHLPNFFRTPYGSGWALVGDAGCHKDPCLAQGIADAFRDAQLLADAIIAGLGGRSPLEHTLASYEQQRNEASLDLYQLCLHIASFKPLSERVSHQVLSLNCQDQIDRYVAMLHGTVPVKEYCSPEYMQHLQALT